MKKQLNYWLSIIILIVLLLVPLSFAVVFSITEDFKWLTYAGYSAIFFFVAYKPLSAWRIRARDLAQTDEFGNSKRKTYAKLSQKERDAIDLQKTADAERLVGSVTLKKMTKPGSRDPQKDLDELIGLTNVKQKIAEMAAKMEFDKQEKKRQGKKFVSQFDSGHHAVYFGSPGTGKTTVARIMTGFLYKYGYIKENKCVEVDGNFLKAGSETATKTTMVIRQAFGGVLFVDEAYALVQGDQYGQDAIATLIKQMEDNRDRFVLILAGYTNEMRDLLESNPGFQSRLKEYLYFDDYNDNDMCTIFRAMAKSKGYSLDLGAEQNLLQRIQNERPLPSFGNARTARSILDEAMEKHAYHFIALRLPEDQRYVISARDLDVQPKII
ncbi:MAG: AAA family ATPase [Bacteroidaceae bacterium]|nr:AAA family ATPase [Bacteroidaceae bacterium]